MHERAAELRTFIAKANGLRHSLTADAARIAAAHAEVALIELRLVEVELERRRAADCIRGWQHT